MTTTHEKTEAIAQLRETFPRGTEVHIILRHVSRSGMERAISVIGPDLMDVSYLVARATGRRIHPRHDGVKCGGCGMDMGFDLVYSLAMAMYNDGYALRHRWL